MLGINNWKRSSFRLIAGVALFSALGLALSTLTAKADVVITAGADKKVKIWDPATGNELKSIAAHESAVNVIAVSPDGKLLATGGADKKVKIWNIEKGELVKEIAAHTEEVTALAFSPDGKMLASGGSDKKIKFWSLPDGKADGSIDVAGKVVGITLVPANESLMIIAGLADGTVPILGKDGNAVFTLNTEHKGGLTATGGNLKEMCVYSGGADGLLKYFSQSGQGEFEGGKHEGAVNAIATSSDSEKVLTGGADGKLIVWGASDHKKIATIETGLKSVKSVAISPDGKRIFTGGDKKVKVWENGKELVAQDCHEGMVNAILYVADKKKVEDKK